MSGELLEDLPADPVLERRELVQRVARKSLRRRMISSRIMVIVCLSALALALIPLVAVIIALVSKGLKWWSTAFFTQSPGVPGVGNLNDVGGYVNAIIGSLVIDSIAILIAVPIGIIAGLLLSETDNPFTNTLRTTAEVMTGLPGILIGIFIFQVLVIGVNFHGIKIVPTLGFSGLAGSVALAILMIPIIMKASETSLRSVPPSIREAGLALGAKRGAVARRVVIPTALPGLITASLIALSRAVGETAPVLFVVGASIYNKTTWNPFHPMSTMPLSIYLSNSAITQSQQDAAWGLALFLVVVVLIINLGARLIAAFIQRERR